MVKLVPRREVLKVLGICYKTLYKMAENNEIESIKVGKMTMYNLEKYINDKKISDTSTVPKEERLSICYCRVSSNKQKNDLKRQIKYMEKKYPNYQILSDIGSGLNLKRKNLQKIIKMAIEGRIKRVIVAHKDRLARFGYDLIEWIIETYSKGRIVVINKSEEETPMEEISKDIIQIMNVYTAKINGLRKYKKKMTKMIKNESI
jgi:predicted site-specific integrase-resolvase